MKYFNYKRTVSQVGFHLLIYIFAEILIKNLMLGGLSCSFLLILLNCDVVFSIVKYVSIYFYTDTIWIYFNCASLNLIASGMAMKSFRLLYYRISSILVIIILHIHNISYFKNIIQPIYVLSQYEGFGGCKSTTNFSFLPLAIFQSTFTVLGQFMVASVSYFEEAIQFALFSSKTRQYIFVACVHFKSISIGIGYKNPNPNLHALPQTIQNIFICYAIVIMLFSLNLSSETLWDPVFILS